MKNHWTTVLFAAVLFLSVCRTPGFGQNSTPYYLYQRTMYLENLTMNGAWWANPALTGEITEKTASTVNVTPLAGRYTIVSAKYLFPFSGIFGAGFGIMGGGIGPNQAQSTQGSNTGLTYSSHFTFTNPSFQGSFGMRPARFGSAGLLLNAGLERIPLGDGTSYNYPTTGLGIGLLTPYFFNSLSLSFTAMATWHFWDQLVFMDNDGKAGIRFKILDDFILGSLEYGFIFKSDFTESSYYTTSGHYQIAKARVSIRFYKIAGLLLGYSTNFGVVQDLGATLHAGLELRPSEDYPFFGGYELGFSTYWRDLIIHQIWVGYCFRTQTR